MKVLGISLALIALVGCGSTCKDGKHLEYGFAGWSYTECSKGCCRQEKPLKCKCTDRCSCNHGASKPE